MRTEREILAEVKTLAVEYYELTERPLGVTGEIAEFEAAEKLGLGLTPPRTRGYDAVRPTTGERIQIKGRRIADSKHGRVGQIDLEKAFDSVVLVLLNQRFDAVEIWEAPRGKVEARLQAPGSKARNERGALGISQFKSIAKLVWPV